MKKQILILFVLSIYKLQAFGGPAQVKIERVISNRLAPTTEYVATSLPVAKSRVSSTGQGLIIDRRIFFGVPVEKNQIVLVLDSKHLQAVKAQQEARLEQAQMELQEALNGARSEELEASRARWIRSQARLKESSASLTRILGLFSNAATTAEDVDLKKREFEIAQAEETESLKSFQLVQSGERKERIAYLNAKVDEAQMALQSIQLQIEDMNIKAPFAGIAGEVSVEVGDWIKIGDSIADLIDSTYLDLAVLVPEETIAQVQPMQKVPVRFTGFPEFINLEGLVVSIGPLATLQGKTIPVIIRVKNPGPIIAGMSARATLPVGPKVERILVPKDAILRTAGQQTVKVYVNENSKAQLRIVDVGQEFGNFLEVFKGLQVNDEVVTRGNERLRPGSELALTNSNIGDSNVSQ